MALVSCPDCGKQISDAAPACINCGRPMRENKEEEEEYECMRCGSTVKAYDKICPKCGDNLEGDDPARNETAYTAQKEPQRQDVLMTNTKPQGSSNQTTTVIIKRDSGNALGIASFVFGLLSIFFLAPVFVPIALLLGIIAVIKKQLVWGVLGLICGLVGFLTSPILLGIFGLATLGSLMHSSNKPLPSTSYVPPKAAIVEPAAPTPTLPPAPPVTAVAPTPKPLTKISADSPITVSWKKSGVWTGSQVGPLDGTGHTWKDFDFNDSLWTAVTLPDSGNDSSADDRYYRAHFAWDGVSPVGVNFISDDGIAIYVNGNLLGSWGNGWRQPGCINGALDCSINSSVPLQLIPANMLKVGDNIIAVDLWNSEICCNYYLDAGLTRL